MHPGLMLVLVTRIVVSAVSGALLFSKWLKPGKRYLSDFPFILAVMFLTLAFAKVFDFYIGLNFTRDSPSEDFSQLIIIRYILLAANITIMLVLVLIIWFRARRGLQILIFSGYAVSWAILFLTIPDYETLSKTGSMLMIPVIIVVLLTFIFIHHQKRLGNKFNALVIIYGISIYMASQFLRPTLVMAGSDEWGYLWITELMDLCAWLLIFYAFFKPLRKMIKVTAPARNIHG